MLQRLEPKDPGTDLLFIGTDRQQYFTLRWNHEGRYPETVSERLHDEAEPYMRQSQSQNQCLVDPTGKYLVLHLWEGVINVLRLRTRGRERTNLEALAQVRHTELWMKASTFLHSRTGHPIIAFLYKTQQEWEEARLAIYRLTKDDKGSDVSKFDPQKDRLLDQKIQDPHASMLIPVPVPEEKRYHVRRTEGVKPHLGGLLVIGETLLTYVDSLTYATVVSTLSEPKLYVAWEAYDETRFVLADDYGRMDLLTIETETEHTGGIVVTGLTIDPLQFEGSETHTSRASKLISIEHDYIFLASHHGDSQLLCIDPLNKIIKVVSSESNNAPILDFAIMDIGNREGSDQGGNAFASGQTRLVAGCGAYRDGTLRSIRSGIVLADHGILLDVEGVRGLFALKSQSSESVDTLIMSLIGESRVFRFGLEGEIEEVFEYQGMELETETLVARNLPSGLLLQATPGAVTLLDPDSGVMASNWEVPAGRAITAISANDKWVLLALDGTTLVTLNLELNLNQKSRDTQQSRQGETEDQVACLCAAQSPEGLGVVGWWASGTVSVINLETLDAIRGESLRQTEDSSSVARDVCLAQLHPRDRFGPTLLIATEDGNVVTYDVSADGHELSGRKSVTLGNSPSRFHLLPHGDGECSIFATTEFASLIHSDDGRVVYSATTADDATYVVPLPTQTSDSSIIISTDSHVRMCFVDKMRRTHVKSLTIGESVRRVAYSPELRAFGLGCIKKELVNNQEIVTSSVKLVDEIIFEELGTPFKLDQSAGIELIECIIRAQVSDAKKNHSERFIVGTSFIQDDPKVKMADRKFGRIVVLGVDENRQLYQILSRTLKGSCRSLATMEGGYIVAGLQKTVVVYKYSEDTSTSASLEKLATYRPANVPVTLDVSGHIIGIADLTQSLTLVEFIPPSSGNDAKIQERANHFSPSWSTALCHLDDEQWLEADAHGNLCVARRNAEAPTEEDKRRMDVVSEINIGEQINKIHRLILPPNENAVVSPKAFLASVSHHFRLCSLARDVLISNGNYTDDETG
jgi:DNA damage-binding protein 1